MVGFSSLYSISYTFTAFDQTTLLVVGNDDDLCIVIRGNSSFAVF